ncbi:type II secretion system protein [Paraburkholderia caledonica]|jgi:type II secretory pathway pseudopilin PulG|uniref:type II secretion system protein n=1 Tax=Paraburkholderia caledonica TaxID=134536 RepID=UPI0038BC2A13
MTAQDQRGRRGGRRGPQRARAARRGWRTSHRQRGLAYLALLIGIAIIGIAAAGTIQLGALYRRRMAEKELLYVGDQFQRALLSYADNTPLGLPTQPRTLEELLRDPRCPNPMRHLHRVYADPMTGKADWVLVLSRNGQTIVGIHSASREHPIKLRQFPERFRGFEDKRSYMQWVFVARAAATGAGAAATERGDGWDAGLACVGCAAAGRWR